MPAPMTPKYVEGAVSSPEPLETEASQPWPLWWAGKLSHPAVYFEGELGFICSHIHI